ncbi:MAG: DUF4138 domain-containing protein [Cytophagales bacterium]|nr:DUF4138 domain-containing protein [Cytophagales bacterium]MCA6372323.1 DUF4138 domain-containing protein [Cytophagales bacterium]MCA6382469.1 DUF4138 domain-containing protein [Cytophagales bacterium]
MWTRKPFLFLFSLSPFVSVAQLDTIYVANSMTTTIVFDGDIVFADIGSKLYEPRAKDNVLLVNIKPNVNNAPPTSLTVKSTTSVGVWLVVQNNSPKKLLYTPDADRAAMLAKSAAKTPAVERIESAEVETVPVKRKETASRLNANATENREAGETSNSSNPLNINDTFPADLKRKVKNILKGPQMFWDVAEKKNSMLLSLYSINVDTKYTYFTCKLANYSSIGFTLDFLSIDRIPFTKSMRKSQAGGVENIPLSYEYFPVEVEPDGQGVLVFAMPLQAFDDRDMLEFKLSESGGSRTLRFSFSCKSISKAKSI